MGGPAPPAAARRADRQAPRDHRLALDGILWILHTGAPWRDLPDRFGPWRTAYHRFDSYRKRGVRDRILEALARDADLDHSQWDVDGTVVRAQRSAAGAGKEIRRRPASRLTTRWGARGEAGARRSPSAATPWATRWASC